MDKILTVELSGRNDTYAVAQLPLTPYELLDTLDKLRMTPRDEPEWEILAYHDYAELRDWIGSGSAYELNALCTRFSELNGQERLAFEGLVQMDKDKGLKIIPMHRLLDLAYSTGQCHLLEDVHNLDQLGRFAAENGFVPEEGHLPDEAFELLDFKRIGERFMRDEGGVIVKGVYVAQDGDLARDVWKMLELTPREPDYAVLVELGVMDTDRAALLKLPAPPAELDAALDRVEAETWDEITYRCADCRVPALRDAITLADNIAQANRAAVYLAHLPERDVPKYKALISALGITELHDALELTERLDEYGANDVLTPCRAVVAPVCDWFAGGGKLPRRVNRARVGAISGGVRKCLLADKGGAPETKNKQEKAPTLKRRSRSRRSAVRTAFRAFRADADSRCEIRR